MTHYLESILPNILSYSNKLDKLALLLNEPWVVTGDESTKMKLIFKNDGEVIVSENGNVQFGKWELLNRASAILIKYEKTARLYNHTFFDESVLALKLDGSNDFFVLANQNKIPDLDVGSYLGLKYGGQNKDGLEINTSQPQPYRCKTDKGEITISANEESYGVDAYAEGYVVIMENRPAPDGKYRMGIMDYIHVKDGRIYKMTIF